MPICELKRKSSLSNPNRLTPTQCVRMRSSASRKSGSKNIRFYHKKSAHFWNFNLFTLFFQLLKNLHRPNFAKNEILFNRFNCFC